jgi:hypothetical protein
MFVVDGEVKLGEYRLKQRDAIGVTDVDTVGIESISNAELILIEVPMQ